MTGRPSELGQLGSHGARDHVDRAAWRKRHDERDGARRIVRPRDLHRGRIRRRARRQRGNRAWGRLDGLRCRRRGPRRRLRNCRHDAQAALDFVEARACQVGEDRAGKARDEGLQHCRAGRIPRQRPDALGLARLLRLCARQFRCRRQAGEIDVAAQGGIVPRDLAVFGGARNIGTHLGQHLAHLEPRRAHVLDEAFGEGAVRTHTIERHLVGGSRERDQRAGAERRVGGEAGTDRAGANLRGEAPCQRIVAARVEDDDVGTVGLVEAGKHLVELDHAEIEIACRIEPCVDRHQVVASFDLEPVAGIKE